MKPIASLADLAVCGAPPAFSQPVHVGRPNVGSEPEFLAHIQGMLERNWLSNNGPLVQELEARIADYLGVRNCVAMCNGTVALEIAIRALGLSGEVIIPSYTFIATAHALHWQEITPVFADIDPLTHTLDPAAVRRMITPRTTGIIGVHLWGRAAPQRELQRIADEHGLTVLYDAAHAFGCSSEGELIGRFGACEVFSFHATKVFNTLEGGAVVTSNDALAEKMRLMRNFGFAGFDNVIHPGTNGKMVEACAAMGLANLAHLDSMIAANFSNYVAYETALAGLPGIRLREYVPGERHNYQYVIIEVGPDSPVARDRIVEALHAENILARKYFWPGCHRMQPYKALFPHAGLMLPHTERVAASVVVLPTGISLAPEVPAVVAAVIRALGEH